MRFVTTTDGSRWLTLAGAVCAVQCASGHGLGPRDGGGGGGGTHADAAAETGADPTHFIVPGTGPVCADPLTAVAGPTVVLIDGVSGGRRFDTIGALSAGASSRLLYDYPPAQRSEILDYLFKPGFGASLQLLKVEIGADTDSTCGSEPGHERTPDDKNFRRGYEWWLMQQAKARNPAIKLAGLQWGAPGWMTSFFSPQNIAYIVDWVKGAQETYGLTIDYVGGWNEMGYSASWFVDLKAALLAAGLTTEIIAADTSGSWDIANAMNTNPALDDAVDIIGSHYACGWMSDGSNCGSLPFVAAARNNGHRVWASEEGSQPYTSGAVMARTLIRSYIEGGITGTINWSLVGSWYSNLPFAGVDGLLLANQPWSGYYAVDKSIWVTAHTAQFVEPGWRYLDTGSQLVPGVGSFASLMADDERDWTLLVETTNATDSREFAVSLGGGALAGPVHVWSTDLTVGSTGDEWFVKGGDISPAECGFTFTALPHHFYSLTTTTGQSKGTTQPPPPAALALPYVDDFESYTVGAMPNLPRYFSPVNGGFEVERCAGGRSGVCLQQEIAQAPIKWGNAGAGDPATMVGDPTWTDYRVEADALLQHPGTVDLVGRIVAQSQYGSGLQGYHLLVSDVGAWTLARQNGSAANTALASGTVSFGVGTWHALALELSGGTITALYDGALLGTATDTLYGHGNVALGSSKWTDAQFDNLRVTGL